MSMKKLAVLVPSYNATSMLEGILRATLARADRRTTPSGWWNGGECRNVGSSYTLTRRVMEAYFVVAGTPSKRFRWVLASLLGVSVTDLGVC